MSEFHPTEPRYPAGEYLLDFPLDARDVRLASMVWSPSAGVWYHHWRKWNALNAPHNPEYNLTQPIPHCAS